tara:strand:- start:5655 stop:5960 length:306 start_codon:yes stop_codon:yes gene_type:complete
MELRGQPAMQNQTTWCAVQPVHMLAQSSNGHLVLTNLVFAFFLIVDAFGSKHLFLPENLRDTSVPPLLQLRYYRYILLYEIEVFFLDFFLSRALFLKLKLL